MSKLDRDGFGFARLALTIALFSLVPLFRFLPAYDSFIGPKYALISVLTGALLVLSAVQSLRGRPDTLPLNRFTALTAAWVAWNLVSILWAKSPTMAWDDARQWLILSLGALLALNVLGRDRRRWILLGWAMTAAAAVTALWAIGQDAIAAWIPESRAGVAISLSDWRNYIFTSFGNPGHVSDFLALTFWIPMMFYLYGRQSWVWVVSAATMVLSAAAMTVCWSVHSNGGLILASLVSLVVMTRHYGLGFWRRRARRVVVLIVLFAGVVGFYLTDHPANPHRPSLWEEAFGSERWRDGGITRVYIWRTGLQMAADQRFLGVGAGNFQYVFPSVVVPSLGTDPEYLNYHRFTRDAHNEPLQTWAELGIVGFLLLMSMFATVFWRLWTDLKRDDGFFFPMRLIGLAFFTAFAVHSQMTFSLQLPVTSFLFLFMFHVPAALESRRCRYEMGLLRVENEWGPWAFIADVVGMRRLRNLGVKPVNTLGAVVLMGVAGLMAVSFWWGDGRRLLADTRYRDAREAHDRWRAMRPGQNNQTPISESFRLVALKQYESIFAIDANHHDARSAFTTFLIETEEYADALPQIDKTMERLDAAELYQRRALCLEALGRESEAIPDWATYYMRFPQAISLNRDHAASILEKAEKLERSKPTAGR